MNVEVDVDELARLRVRIDEVRANVDPTTSSGPLPGKLLPRMEPWLKARGFDVDQPIEVIVNSHRSRTVRLQQ